MRLRWMGCAAAMAWVVMTGAGVVAQRPVAHGVEKIFLDTDIGDDVDDAFALALALKSPELQIVGISGGWGDTELRARMIVRMLDETGHTGIPVGAGVKTQTKTTFTQRTWAEGSTAKGPFPDGVAMLRDAILKYPGELTLVGIAPLTNVGALIEQDPATFRKLKRVVIMGGAVYVRYNGQRSSNPSAEYNIAMDAKAAQRLFASGVPVSVMPLDSTLVQMTEAKRAELYAQGTPMAKILQELDSEWVEHQERKTPTLFDVVAVAAAIDPKVCPVTPMRLVVDDKGFTRPAEGKANVEVCLKLDEERFLQLYYGRLIAKP